MPGYDVESFYGLWAPARTPREICPLCEWTSRPNPLWVPSATAGCTWAGGLLYPSGDTYLIFNTDYVYHTDSDTDFEFAIRVSGVHTPDASWFV